MNESENRLDCPPVGAAFSFTWRIIVHHYKQQWREKRYVQLLFSAKDADVKVQRTLCAGDKLLFFKVTVATLLLPTCACFKSLVSYMPSHVFLFLFSQYLIRSPEIFMYMLVKLKPSTICCGCWITVAKVSHIFVNEGLIKKYSLTQRGYLNSAWLLTYLPVIVTIMDSRKLNVSFFIMTACEFPVLSKEMNDKGCFSVSIEEKSHCKFQHLKWLKF